MTTTTLTVSSIELETIIACIRQRAVVIGNATRGDRIEQERLYRLAAQLDQQTDQKETETQ